MHNHVLSSLKRQICSIFHFQILHSFYNNWLLFQGRTARLHFIDEKAKMNVKYYVKSLRPRVLSQTVGLTHCFLVASYFSKTPPPHTPHDWRSSGFPPAVPSLEFTSKEEWPPISPHLNPLDYHVWGAMLDLYRQYQPRRKNISDLKVALHSIWNDLPQDPIDSHWYGSHQERALKPVVNILNT